MSCFSSLCKWRQFLQWKRNSTSHRIVGAGNWEEIFSIKLCTFTGFKVSLSKYCIWCGFQTIFSGSMSYLRHNWCFSLRVSSAGSAVCSKLIDCAELNVYCNVLLTDLQHSFLGNLKRTCA